MLVHLLLLAFSLLFFGCKRLVRSFMLHIQVNNSIDYHTVRWLILLETKQKLDIFLVSLGYQSVIRKIPLPLG